MSMATTDPRASNGALTESKPIPQRREIRVVEDEGPIAYLLDTARFEHLQRIAALMADASLLPKHLHGKGEHARQQSIANCFLVVNQALRWKMDPFAILPETYEVGGKLGYQGKLVAALVNSRAGLKANLRYEFNGSGEDRSVRAIGIFDGEEEARDVIVTLRDARTSNDMWRKDPDQKLIYNAAIKWARRHCPEVLLGVLTDDDVDRIAEGRAITVESRPAATSLDELTARIEGSFGARQEANGVETDQTADKHPESKPAEADNSTPQAASSTPETEWPLLQDLIGKLADRQSDKSIIALQEAWVSNHPQHAEAIRHECGNRIAQLKEALKQQEFVK